MTEKVIKKLNLGNRGLQEKATKLGFTLERFQREGKTASEINI